MQRCEFFIALIVGLLVFAGSGSALAKSDTSWVVESSALWVETPISLAAPGFQSEGEYLDVLFSDSREISWMIQRRSVFNKSGAKFVDVPFPQNFTSAPIAACESTGVGEILLVAGNEVWKCRISEDSEIIWENTLPRLPKGFRCVDVIQDLDGDIWVRSREILFRLENKNPNQEWTLVSGSPHCVETPGGMRNGMGLDPDGRLWAFGFRSAKAGFWIWDARRELWKEVPSPEGVGKIGERLPVMIHQTGAGIYPMVLCGDVVYRLTDWVWEKVFEGKREKPWIASWSNVNQQLWIWDRAGGGKLTHWSPDNTESADVVDWKVHGLDSLPTLLVALEQPGTFLFGTPNRVMTGRRVANAIHDWTRTGLEIDKLSVEAIGSGTWAALSEAGDALVELRWAPATEDNKSKVELTPVVNRLANDFRINDFIWWSGNYWLATTKGLMIHPALKESKTRWPQTGQDVQPPMPGQTPALRLPAGIKAESALIGNAVSRIGIIPEAGIWALMEDGSLMWIWTQPELEAPGWVESHCPWRLESSSFIQAWNPNQAIVSIGNRSWITEAKYSFVAEGWSWNRSEAPKDFERLNSSNEMKSAPPGWVVSGASGLIWMDLNGNHSQKQSWISKSTEDFYFHDTQSTITGGTWEKPTGWLFNKGTLFSFQGEAVLKTGRTSNSEVHQSRLIGSLDHLGSGHSVILCNSTQWTIWPVESKRMQVEPVNISNVVTEVATGSTVKRDGSSQVNSLEESRNPWKLWGGILSVALIAGVGVVWRLKGSESRGGLLKAAQNKLQGSIHKESMNPIKEQGSSDAMEKAMQNYWSVLGHELRTPLNAILGYAELLDEDLQGASGAEQKKDVKRIIQAARREITLIRATIDYASGVSAPQKKFERFRVTGAMARQAALQAIRNVSSVSFSKQCEIKLEPNLSRTEVGQESDLIKDPSPPELARMIEYFLEACLHADPGGRFHFEISENLGQPAGKYNIGSRKTESIGIRLWGCQWPEDHLELKKWLAEMDPWKSLFEEEGGENDAAQFRCQDLPLWKICLALSQTLARRMGGELGLVDDEGNDAEVKRVAMQLKFSPVAEQG